MLSRLMDLIVLVAEFNREGQKSFQEIDEELTFRGYSSEEIEQARIWIASVPVQVEGRSPNAIRVLNKWEQMSLDCESHGYLLRLLNLGIIDIDQFEEIMARIIPLGPEKISLSDVKAIASAVAFYEPEHESDEEMIDTLEDENLTS